MAPGVDEAIAGASAGVTGTLLGYPLDALKGRMQASQGGLLINARALANSGVFSTYRGVTAPLINMAVLNTLSFSTYAQTRQLVGLPPLGNSTERDSALWRVCIAGSLVAVPITVVSTPFELVKLQTQLHPAGGALATAAAIYRRHGIGALYTGSIVNGAREVVFLGCYFTCYEKLKATLLADAHITHAVAVPVSGGLSGACAWLLSFPLDTVKTAVQGRPLDGNSRLSAIDAGAHLLRSRGVSGLYRGAVPSVMRAFIVSGTRFSTYEVVIAALQKAPP